MNICIYTYIYIHNFMKKTNKNRQNTYPNILVFCTTWGVLLSKKHYTLSPSQVPQVLPAHSVLHLVQPNATGKNLAEKGA